MHSIPNTNQITIKFCIFSFIFLLVRHWFIQTFFFSIQFGYSLAFWRSTLAKVQRQSKCVVRCNCKLRWLDEFEMQSCMNRCRSSRHSNRVASWPIVETKLRVKSKYSHAIYENWRSDSMEKFKHPYLMVARAHSTPLHIPLPPAASSRAVVSVERAARTIFEQPHGS